MLLFYISFFEKSSEVFLAFILLHVPCFPWLPPLLATLLSRLLKPSCSYGTRVKMRNWRHVQVKSQVCIMYDLRVIVAVVVLHQLDVWTCLMKVITASSKRCNKVCELFEQCMSEYRAGAGMHSLSPCQEILDGHP